MLEKITSLIAGAGGAMREAGSKPEAAVLLSSGGRKISANFDSVKSIEDCVNLLRSHNLIPDGIIPDELMEVLSDHAAQMRQKGFALEPNLLGRALCRCLHDTRRMGAWSVKFAAADTDWRQYVAAGDAARDSGSFPEAEYNYYFALGLFPAHPGVQTQYAHSLKEQDKNIKALVHFLNAYLSGATRTDLEEHLRFVARIVGREELSMAFLKSKKRIPLSYEISFLHRLLIDEDPSSARILDLMLQNESKEDIVMDIMSDARFPARNRDLIQYFSERALGAGK